MADTALFIGYGPTIPGREQRALALFNEVLGYYTKLQQRGEIESFEAVLLEPHGGELGGFLLLRGEAEKLDRVRRSEEFLGYNAQAGLVVLNFGVVGAYIGAGLECRSPNGPPDAFDGSLAQPVSRAARVLARKDRREDGRRALGRVWLEAVVRHDERVINELHVPGSVPVNVQPDVGEAAGEAPGGIRPGERDPASRGIDDDVNLLAGAVGLALVHAVGTEHGTEGEQQQTRREDKCE